MTKKVYPEGMNPVCLTDNHYLASGGEADIFLKDGLIYKLYHDPSRMIAPQKIRELAGIGHPKVVTPERVVFGSKHRPVGFTMAYVDGGEPLARFFSKTFKRQKGLGVGDVSDLVQAMADTVADVHGAGCLLVDMNELNLLVDRDLKTPWFIDTDSWQTPSFKATAIAEAVRDRLSPKGLFTRETDWFSFAVLAFQLFIGVHPYKGGHPRYKPSEWPKRMDDGVSVFHPQATLPPSAEPFQSAPPDLLDWFRWVFREEGRGAPPRFSRHVSPVLPAPQAPISASFSITSQWSFSTQVIRVFSFYGALFIVTEDALHRNGKCLIRGIDGKGVHIAMSPSGTPVLAVFDGVHVMFQTLKQEPLGKVPAQNLFSQDGVIYTMQGPHLQEHAFTQMNDQVFRRTRIAATLNSASAKMFDGVIFRKLMGRTWLTMPLEAGRCKVSPVPELDSWRVVEAGTHGQVCMVLAERRGTWRRLDLLFNQGFTVYQCRWVETDQRVLNFAVLPNGVCASVSEDSQLELFTSFNHAQTLDKAPVDLSKPLFQHDGGLWQIRGTDVVRLSMT